MYTYTLLNRTFRGGVSIWDEITASKGISIERSLAVLLFVLNYQLQDTHSKHVQYEEEFKLWSSRLE